MTDSIYLKNNLCNFTPLFKIDYSVKKNIISCSFFKRNNSYYKSFSKYVKGIQSLYYNVIKNYKHFSVRLFIDNSIYKDNNIMKKLKKLDKLEIILYDCPMYKINNNYHQGLFGTLIRFFPMFNFPNNDAKIVILSDIDDYSFKKYFELFKIIGPKINDLYLIKFANAGRMFKNKELFNTKYQNVILDYIKPQEIVCLKQIDYNVIIDFFKNLDSKIKYSYYINKNLIRDNNYISKYENNGHFIYGIDEYFLNNDYIKYFIKNKKPFVEKLNFNIFNPYYYQIISRNELWLDKDMKRFNNLMDKILLYLKIKPNIKLKEKLNSILKIIDKNNNDSINLKYKLYKLFIKNRDKKKYRFLFNTIYNDILLNKYRGIYEFSELNFYNSNINSFFIKKKSFDEKKIAKKLV